MYSLNFRGGRRGSSIDIGDDSDADNNDVSVADDVDVDLHDAASNVENRSKTKNVVSGGFDQHAATQTTGSSCPVGNPG